mmetsp:Transcript_13652/g.22286  ORF Transcript_13652/g.22286 Transcript_13652/m.22286 type:complete len:670 (+) Transcript_13652:209-2218(+)
MSNGVHGLLRKHSVQSGILSRAIDNIAKMSQTNSMLLFTQNAVFGISLPVQCLIGVILLPWGRSVLEKRGDRQGLAKWWWVELISIVYLMGMLYVVAFTVTADLSKRYKELLVDRENASPPLSGLHRTWLSELFGGRLMELKDAQYHEFHDLLPLLAVASIGYVTVDYFVRLLSHEFSRRGRMQVRAWYAMIVSLGAIIYVHEAGALKIIFFTILNFVLCRLLIVLKMGRATPVILWVYNLVILYLNDTYRGYKFVHVFGPSPWSFYFDGKSGLMQWHHSFNLVMLRMMSFNMDYWWREQAVHGENSTGPSLIWTKETDEEIKDSRKVKLDERSRVDEYHPLFAYDNFVVYLGYLLYFPLYIAGPTMTFNSFVSHLAMPQQTYSYVGKIVYTVRFVLIFLLFEVLSHFIYPGAITYMALRYKIQEIDPTTNQPVQTPLIVYLTRERFGGQLDFEQVIFYSYWSLMYLWFKFMLIWRFFRLWAVCDDIEPVENMERCMNNNYTVGGFWRGWHRSFNRWLVRYIYIPLGGKERGPIMQAFNVTVVFTFVGFWHDIDLNLFVWGWLLSLFLVPEIVANRVSKIPIVKNYFGRHPLQSEWVIAVCGALNIMMLKIANIVGYTTGVSGGLMLLDSLKSTNGVKFVSSYAMFMVLAVLTMQFIQRTREEYKLKRV